MSVLQGVVVPRRLTSTVVQYYCTGSTSTSSLQDSVWWYKEQGHAEATNTHSEGGLCVCSSGSRAHVIMTGMAGYMLGSGSSGSGTGAGGATGGVAEGTGGGTGGTGGGPGYSGYNSRGARGKETFGCTHS